MSRTRSKRQDARRRLPSWGITILACLALYTILGTLVAPFVAERLIVRMGEDRLGRAPTIEAIRVNPFTLAVRIDGFALPDRTGTDILSFQRLEANARISSLARRAAVLEVLRIDRPTIALRRFEDGEINLLELWADLERLSPPSRNGFQLPPVVLERIEITSGSLVIEDHGSPVSKVWQWTPVDAELDDISTLPDHQGENVVTVALGDGGLLTASGVVTIEPFDARGEIHVEGAVIANPWRAVAERFGFRPRSGKLGVDLTYQLGVRKSDLDLRLEAGTGRIESLVLEDTLDGTRFLSIDSVSFSGLRVHWPEQRVEIESVVVAEADALAWIDADGSPSWDRWVPPDVRVQLQELFRAYLEPAVELDRLEVREAKAFFEDRRFPEHLVLEASSVDLALGGVSYEPLDERPGSSGNEDSAREITTSPGATVGAAQLELVAALPEGGHARVTGRLDPFDPLGATILEIDARDFPLRTLSPVILDWFGFPVESGVSEVHSNLRIDDQALASTHRFDIDGLTLGRRIEGRGRVHLPMRLGVALLQGPDDRIGLDLPIEGDLGNPKFILASAFRGAIAAILKDLATAPFRLLAKIGGGSDADDLETVEFRPGQSSLEPAVRADLEIVSEALRKRPALALEITGAADPETDRDALTTAALTEALGGSAPEDAPVEALEKLYAEIGGTTEAVETARSRFEADNERYREALLDTLMREAEVDDGALDQLAAARAGTIREFLLRQGGVAGARIEILTTAEIRPADGDRVRCRLGVVVPSPGE